MLSQHQSSRKGEEEERKGKEEEVEEEDRERGKRWEMMATIQTKELTSEMSMENTRFSVGDGR